MKIFLAGKVLLNYLLEKIFFYFSWLKVKPLWDLEEKLITPCTQLYLSTKTPVCFMMKTRLSTTVFNELNR